MQKLPAEVQAKIRSGVAIHSHQQCVEELVLNAVDASATCVAVRVDIACGKIQCVDNGCGMSEAEITQVGDRYTTSKCQGLSDLENIQNFGYRGEALASIRDICFLLEIESRSKNSPVTRTRVFKSGSKLQLVQGEIQRPSSGTTITVYDLFHKLPVRKKNLNEALEIERIRQRLAAIALVHPSISFSLRNDATGQKLLQTHKANSILGSFTHIFGVGKARKLTEVAYEMHPFKIVGYIGKEGMSTKDYQFLYVNDRLVVKTKLHKVINFHLSRSSLLRRKGAWDKIGDGTNRSWVPVDGGSPQKQCEKHAVFVLNIICSNSEYDITFDPRKTLVEFKNWTAMTKCLYALVRHFLEREGFVFPKEPSTDNEATVMAEDTGKESQDSEWNETNTEETHEMEHIPGITPMDTNQCLQSLVVKRPKNFDEENNESLPCDSVAKVVSESPEIEEPSPKVLSASRNESNIDTMDINPLSQKYLTDVPGAHLARAYEHGKTISNNVNRHKVERIDIKPLNTQDDLRLLFDTSNDGSASEKCDSIPHNVSSDQVSDDYLTPIKPTQMTQLLKPKPLNGTQGVRDKTFVSQHPSIEPSSRETITYSRANEEVQNSSFAAFKASFKRTNSSRSQSQNSNGNRPSLSVIKQNLHSKIKHKMSEWEARNTKSQDVEKTQSSSLSLFKKHSNAAKHKNKTSEKKSMPAEELPEIDPESPLGLSRIKDKSKPHTRTEMKSSKITESDEKGENEDYKPISASEVLKNFQIIREKLKLNGKNIRENQDENLSHHLLVEAKNKQRQINDTRSAADSMDSDSQCLMQKPLTYPEKSILEESSGPNETGSFKEQSRNKIYETERTRTSACNTSVSFNALDMFGPPGKEDTELKDSSSSMFLTDNRPKIKPVSHSQSTLASKLKRKSELSYNCERVDLIPEKCPRSPQWISEPTDARFSKVPKEDKITYAQSHGYGILDEDDRYDHKSLRKRQEMAPLSNNKFSQPPLYEKHFMNSLQESDQHSRQEMEKVQHTSEVIVREKDNRTLTSFIDNKTVASPKIVSIQSLNDFMAQNNCHPYSVATDHPEVEKPMYATQSFTVSHLDDEEKSISVSHMDDEQKSNNESQCHLQTTQGFSTNLSTQVFSETIHTQPFEVKCWTPDVASCAAHSIGSSSHATLRDIKPSSMNHSGQRDDKSSELDPHKTAQQRQNEPSAKSNILASPLSTIVEESPLLKDHVPSEAQRMKNEAPAKKSDVSTLPSCGEEIAQVKGLDVCVNHHSENEATAKSTNTPVSANEQESAKMKDNVKTNDQNHDFAQNVGEVSLASRVRNKLSGQKGCSELLKTPPMHSELSSVWIQETDYDTGQVIYINKVTGNSSFQAPSDYQDNQTVMKTVPEYVLSNNATLFMTDGSSKLRDRSVQPSADTVQDIDTMLSAHRKSQHLENSVKWREKEEFDHILDSKEKDENRQDIQQMFSEWDNPVFKNPQQCAVSVEASGSMVSASRIHQLIHPYKFTKEIFPRLKVLGQLDNKFITCLLQSKGDDPEVLLVIDQHAAHERVRIEKLTAAAYVEEEEGRRILRRSEVVPPVRVELSYEEVRVMAAYEHYFTRIGVEFSMIESQRDAVNVRSLPSCLVQKEATETRRGRDTVAMDLLQSLLQEQIVMVRKTRGGDSTMPKTVHNILCSQACHGAIKFGDALEHGECEELISALAQCQLPFQCAHGRPAVMPLLDMDHFATVHPKQVKPRPRLWKLQQQMAASNEGKGTCD